MSETIDLQQKIISGAQLRLKDAIERGEYQATQVWAELLNVVTNVTRRLLIIEESEIMNLRELIAQIQAEIVRLKQEKAELLEQVDFLSSDDTSDKQLIAQLNADNEQLAAENAKLQQEIAEAMELLK
jgi:cell division protein FtsB